MIIAKEQVAAQQAKEAAAIKEWEQKVKDWDAVAAQKKQTSAVAASNDTNTSAAALPKTGAGSVVAMAAAIAVIGATGHNMMLRRRVTN